MWGETNITQLNATGNLIVGPQYIDVTIRNASTDAVGECSMQQLSSEVQGSSSVCRYLNCSAQTISQHQ